MQLCAVGKVGGRVIPDSCWQTRQTVRRGGQRRQAKSHAPGDARGGRGQRRQAKFHGRSA
eukprot:9077587-Alexandrium_andersonii.AAC.1